jgi:NADP-dependent aldehyde dehydrogenase
MFGNQIAGSDSHQGTRFFSSYNPKENVENTEAFLCASTVEIEEALNLSFTSFQSFVQASARSRGNLLHLIRNELQKSKNEIQHAYCKESGLSKDRFEIEFNRTINQLELFAEYLIHSYSDVVSETPENRILSQPKLVKKRMGIGPVLVFGASNFPLAYSTIGGDSVASFAAGCPLIVKAHPFHPETSYRVGQAIQKAISHTEFHPGIFSQLFDDGHEVAKTLILDSRIKAIGFTGSTTGGKTLLELVNKREIPIPLFAEMGSSNPVFVFPELLKEKTDEWSNLFAKSITNDAGQFCTKPGIFFVPENQDGKTFVEQLIEKTLLEPSFTMLHPSIRTSFEKKKQERHMESGGILVEKEGFLESQHGRQAILVSSIESFAKNKSIQNEVFGPFALVLFYTKKSDLFEVTSLLDGQLTASILLSDNEHAQNHDFIFELSQKVGRIIKNGVPTGVRVCDSMHHGGPFPATTDSRFTAVGTDSIHRFTRPIVYQN